MKNRNKLVLVLIITLNLIYCGKKEENKPQEDTITNIESNASDIESTPMAPETENPSVPSPNSFRNIKEAKGDLDGDQEDELAVVYDTNKEDELGTQREIHIFKKNGDKWDLLHKTSGAVLPSKAGGMMGDPFDTITIEKGALVVHHFGGAREKWMYTHRFRFQKENWYLIGATIEYSVVCEESSSYDYNLSTGKVNVSSTKDSCDSDGNPKGESKTSNSTFTIKDKKINPMDGFVPGNTATKLSKDKTFYF